MLSCLYYPDGFFGVPLAVAGLGTLVHGGGLAIDLRRCRLVHVHLLLQQPSNMSVSSPERRSAFPPIRRLLGYATPPHLRLPRAWRHPSSSPPPVQVRGQAVLAWACSSPLKRPVLMSHEETHTRG